jgi:hypothetical protein
MSGISITMNTYNLKNWLEKTYKIIIQLSHL